jgi:putative acetyltransferase
MAINILRSNASDPAYLFLVALLDKDLAIYDGADHAFYDQYNKSHDIKHVVLLYAQGAAVACGAIKAYNSTIMEVKRMFVLHDHRGNGYSKLVLAELEAWTQSLGLEECILETGLKQVEAIGLYQRAGYSQIENYGPYQGVANSVCFSKKFKTP